MCVHVCRSVGTHLHYHLTTFKKNYDLKPHLQVLLRLPESAHQIKSLSLSLFRSPSTCGVWQKALGRGDVQILSLLHLCLQITFRKSMIPAIFYVYVIVSLHLHWVTLSHKSLQHKLRALRSINGGGLVVFASFSAFHPHFFTVRRDWSFYSFSMFWEFDIADSPRSS